MVDQVHAVLREQILTGALPRGSRLPQETIAAELGVSRTPLREALRRLASEGLVTLQPNHGATVSGVDFNDMNAAWVARLAIEPFAARLAAERRDAGGARSGWPRPSPSSARRSTRPTRSTQTASFIWRWWRHRETITSTHFAELLWVTRISFAIYAAQASESDGVEAWAGEHEQILGRSPPATPTWQSSSPAPICSATHRWSTRTRRDAEPECPTATSDASCPAVPG